ncbi:MAG: B12-binding domain-containing radical SAM protein [Bacteroidetes bacterium]|nr:B12-binding domain-containing radical SAM protein [Bacteroidota bacterium]
MFFTPIQYDEPVFRPPAESRSAIVQATIGCSWNKCAFCEMYTSKKFRVRPFNDVKSDIVQLAKVYKGVRKVFLADGDAFVLSASKLIPLLDEINNQFGKIQRISSYALPKDILNKTDEELLQLKKGGLKLLYIGIETGDDELLKLINKGETSKSTVEGIQKAHRAGMDTSIMIINGLGGKNYAKQHAVASAEIINQLNPKFLSTLTLSMPYGEEHFQKRFHGEYKQQTIVELYDELKLFIEKLDVKNVIYRSNHVSNNLPLQGTLSRDKEKLLSEIQEAIKQTPENKYPSCSSVL